MRKVIDDWSLFPGAEFPEIMASFHKASLTIFEHDEGVGLLECARPRPASRFSV